MKRTTSTFSSASDEDYPLVNVYGPIGCLCPTQSPTDSTHSHDSATSTEDEEIADFKLKHGITPTYEHLLGTLCAQNRVIFGPDTDALYHQIQQEQSSFAKEKPHFLPRPEYAYALSLVSRFVFEACIYPENAIVQENYIKFFSPQGFELNYAYLFFLWIIPEHFGSLACYKTTFHSINLSYFHFLWQRFTFPLQGEKRYFTLNKTHFP